MNQNVIRNFGRKKPKLNINKEFHLWTILENYSKHGHISPEKNATNISASIDIQFAYEGERARKVVRRSNCRMTGKQPSTKISRMVHWESNYEKEVFQLLEIAPFVASYCEQPATFKYKNGDGVIHTHYPDLFVELVNGIKLFLEIKPDSAKGDVFLLNREKLLKKLLTLRGYIYFQVYPNQIESYHYLENAQHMLWHAKVPAPYPVKLKIQKLLEREKEVALGTLIEFLADSNAKSWIFNLVINGFMTCDLSQPLLANSSITMIGE